jgi:hypothetical protein
MAGMRQTSGLVDVPVPFNGSPQQRAINHNSHLWVQVDTDEAGCYKCGASTGDVAADYPCGADIPRMTL